MSDTTDKQAHLEMIQAIITRMAHNSFLLKGWAVTLTAALLGLAVKDEHQALIWVALLPVLTLWLLDGYFLHQERRFRRRFDQVRVKRPDEIDFSMQPEPSSACSSGWLESCFSLTLCIFHGPLLLSVLFAAYLLYR